MKTDSFKFIAAGEIGTAEDAVVDFRVGDAEAGEDGGCACKDSWEASADDATAAEIEEHPTRYYHYDGDILV